MPNNADRLAALLADALADVWVGPDPDAAPVHSCVAGLIRDIAARADQVSRGATTLGYARTLKTIMDQTPPAPPTGKVSRERLAARRLAGTLLSFLPAEVRSMEAMLAAAPARPPDPPPTPPHATPGTRPAAPDTKDQPVIPDVGIQLAAAWPSMNRLQKIIRDILDTLTKSSCLSVLSDIAIWELYVLPRAIASRGVAAALATVFEATSLTGVIPSNMRLGNVVHRSLETRMASALSPMFDRYLVAEDNIYPPGGGGIPRPLEAYASYSREVTKEFSLTVLQNSRGGGEAVRPAGRTASRDDLVVFYPRDLSILPGPIFSGRPEVYEVKPVLSVVDAVSQVTSYSLNYLIASVQTQCGIMLRVPGAQLDNKVMLPASPEAHSLPIFTLSITELGTASQVTMGSPVGAAAIATMVAEFVATKLDIPPYVVIPFMVSGLYGIVPYVVIDLGKLKEVLEVVLSAIIKALLAALSAYLLAKALAEQAIKDKLQHVLEALPLLILTLVAAWFIIPIVIAALAAAPEIVIVAAAVALIILIVSGQQPRGPGAPDRVDPEQSPLTLYLAPLTCHGLTARQIAEFSSTLTHWTQEFLRRGPFTQATA